MNSEQQAEDAWSQLQGWRVAAEEAVKTEKGEKQKWRIKVGQTPRRREREDCAHQQACSLYSVTVTGVFPRKERDIPKSSMKHEGRITRTSVNFTDGVHQSHLCDVLLTRKRSAPQGMGKLMESMWKSMIGV